VSHRRLSLWLAVAAAWCAGSGFAQAGGFVFVRNARNDTAQLTRDDVKELYTGKRKSWKNGTRVDLFLNAAGTAELKWLAEDVIGASQQVVLSKIKEEVFKGDMKKPPWVSSPQECIAEVRKNPGGVCIVDGETARSLPEGVAVLAYAGM
jgi:hypothetical protein